MSTFACVVYRYFCGFSSSQRNSTMTRVLRFLATYSVEAARLLSTEFSLVFCNSLIWATGHEAVGFLKCASGAELKINAELSFVTPSEVVTKRQHLICGMESNKCRLKLAKKSSTLTFTIILLLSCQFELIKQILFYMRCKFYFLQFFYCMFFGVLCFTELSYGSGGSPGIDGRNPRYPGLRHFPRWQPDRSRASAGVRGTGEECS